MAGRALARPRAPQGRSWPPAPHFRGGGARASLMAGGGEGARPRAPGTPPKSASPRRSHPKPEGGCRGGVRGGAAGGVAGASATASATSRTKSPPAPHPNAGGGMLGTGRTHGERAPAHGASVASPRASEASELSASFRPGDFIHQYHPYKSASSSSPGRLMANVRYSASNRATRALCRSIASCDGASQSTRHRSTNMSKRYEARFNDAPTARLMFCRDFSFSMRFFPFLHHHQITLSIVAS